MAEQESPGLGPQQGGRKIVGTSKGQRCPNIWQRKGWGQGALGQRVSVHSSDSHGRWFFSQLPCRMAGAGRPIEQGVHH